MCSTFALVNHTMASPSVCDGLTWNTTTVSPFTCNVVLSLNVITGRALAAAGGILALKNLLSWPSTRRARTRSCAISNAPAFARFSLPPA